MEIFAKIRAACTRGGLFAGKWALVAFAIVAAFALAVQALALVLAALALLVIALCLATVCMPEESRAVWAWMQETLCRWSAVAGKDTAGGKDAVAGKDAAATDKAEASSTGDEHSQAKAFGQPGDSMPDTKRGA